MERLSSTLITKIIERPTNTILKSEDTNLSIQLDSISRVIRTLDDNIIPSNFDGRKAWKGLITPIMNQGSCGSCWV